MSASAMAQSNRGPAASVYELDDALLRWPLPGGSEKYASIDGHRLHDVVKDLTAISRSYRDAGHAQFWGRIIGTSADAESQQYVVERFKRIGLTDVHVQSFDLPPQWMANSWEISVSGQGRTVKIDAAQPIYGTTPTPPDGLNVEAVWVGTGAEADYIGRDVKGKAVFFVRSGRSNPKLAQDKGAVAIFAVVSPAGNYKTQTYPQNASVPSFQLGMNDGMAVLDLIAQSGSKSPRVHIRLEAGTVSGLKTATVWGSLPGATDETIYVLAHRDGWFEGASDNASGVATMIGLAEYFARIPRAQRRRTIVFLGASGHHNSVETSGFSTSRSNMTGTWLLDNQATVFAKTALFINAEHTSALQTFVQTGPGRIRRVNTYVGMQWYAGGPSRQKLQDIAVRAFSDFGVATYAEPESAAPNGEAGGIWPFVPVVQVSSYDLYFHTDADTAEAVPWTGLEAVTRAYARIVDEVNELDLGDLQRPPEVTTSASVN
jgi:hypothetical protein